MKQLVRGIIECIERTDHVTVAEPRELKGEFPVTNSTTKSAIITGASGGIGGSIAKRLAKDGFAVVANYAGKACSGAVFSGGYQGCGGTGHRCASRCGDCRRRGAALQRVDGSFRQA